MKNFYYNGIKLATNKEIAEELGIETESVRHRKNKKQLFLIRLGVTFKKRLESNPYLQIASRDPDF